MLQVGKVPDAVPVRRAHGGEDATALAYRQSNPFDEFSIKLTSFGDRLGLGRQQGLAIIEHLNLKDDDRAHFIRRNRNGKRRLPGTQRALCTWPGRHSTRASTSTQ